MSIRAIFFDYGGTLDSDGIPWKEHFQSIYQAEGILEDQERFDRAFYDADDSLTEEGLEDLSLKDTLLEQVGRVLRNLEINDSSLRERVADAFYTNTVGKIAENEPVLRQLKTRYKLGIISNFYGNLPTICNELSLASLMDVVVDSRRIGHIKPEPGIYNHALQAVGIPAEDAVMVGDSFPRDMLGAKSMGMQHVLFLAEEKKDPPQTCCPGDHIIRRLSDLLEYF